MVRKVQLTTKKGKRVEGRQVVITSNFNTNIETIWCKIQNIETLKEICNPKARFISCDDSPLIWEEGRSFVFKLFMYGFIPVGKHIINIVKLDKASRQIISNEHNQIVTIWNHYIEMEKISDNITKYTDRIDLYAGCLTPVVAWWAVKFYKHRQQQFVEQNKLRPRK